MFKSDSMMQYLLFDVQAAVISVTLKWNISGSHNKLANGSQALRNIDNKPFYKPNSLHPIWCLLNTSLKRRYVLKTDHTIKFK